jgi:hypothetical protein
MPIRIRHSKLRRLVTLAAMFLLGASFPHGNAGTPTLTLSEFLADNENGLVDSFGESSDWIELWNPGSQPVSTEAWFLSDDPGEPTLWALPAFTLGAGDYAVIFASGRDLNDPTGELHTNFRLSRSGTSSLLLSHIGSDSSVTVVSAFAPYPDQYKDTSYGLTGQATSEAAGYFSRPTPGTANASTSVPGFVGDTTFSIDRGFYDAPFEVTVTTVTPGATLIYTTDGSWPTVSHGTRVPPKDGSTPPSATIPVNTTTCLRALAVKTGFEPTNVDTHTYLFPAHVLKQNGIGAPFNQAVSWGHAGPDWEMDPTIVNHPDPEVRPTPDDLKRIPTVSISMEFAEMFGRGGIYIAGQSVEKNVSIELINPLNNIAEPTAAKGFQVDGTVQIVGGTSPNRWKSDNLSMRLKFDRDLQFPVFGRDATDRFDTLVLDAHLGEVWHYGGSSSPTVQRDRAQYARDQFTSDLHLAVGGLSPHGRTVLLYINGIFWGMHTLHERPDDNFAASYLGGDNDDYNVVKHNINTAVNGNLDSYRQLHTLADRDLSVQANFDQVAGLLDIDAFIDYIIVNYYLGNTDWGHQNWYASRNQVLPDGKWRFHSWDAENVMNFLSDNAVSRNNAGGPTNLQYDLATNAGYRLRFADRVHQYFHNGGPMTPENASALYRKRTEPIDYVTRLESARWGDNQRAAPYTRLDWVANRQRLLGERTDGAFGNYFNLRPNIVLNQLRSRGWYPNTPPPDFAPHGGRVSRGFKVVIGKSTSGTIFYTTDGTDPRTSQGRGPTEPVQIIRESAPKRAMIPTNDSIATTWMLPAFEDNGWPVGGRGAGYENSATGAYGTLIDPALNFAGQVGNAALESLYLRVEFSLQSRPDINALRLGVRYDDGFVAYLNGVEIHRENAPGTEGTLVAWNEQATASHADTAAVEFAVFDVSEHLGLLTIGKNVLAIHGLNRGATSTDFLVWPTLEGAWIAGGTPEGVAANATPYTGPFPINQSATIQARVLNGSEWSPVTVASFVVGAVAPTPANLVVSKIHYHPGSPTPEEIAAGFKTDGVFEYIELMNIGPEPVDLSGVAFNEGIDFSFDNSNVREIGSGQRILAVRDRAAFEFRYGPGLPVAGVFEGNTALANSGEFLALVDDTGSVIHRFRYLDTAPWPVLPDGTGPALALVNPTSAPDPSIGASWTSSTSSNGNPGRDDSSNSLQALLATYFNPVELRDERISGFTADPDRDGRSNLEELFFGTDPTVGNAGSPVFTITTDTTDTFRVTLIRSHGLTAIRWTIEESPDLNRWADGTGAFASKTEANTPDSDHDTITLTPNANTRAAALPATRFYRIRLTPATE